MEEDTGVFNPVLLTQITRPQDCFLGVAIPLTLEAVQQQLAAPPETYDFIRKYLSHSPDQTWWEIEGGYGDIVEKKIRPYLQEVRNKGIEIKEGFSLADLLNIQHGFKIIALLAHSPKIGEVELADGIHTVGAFATAIPKDYAGVFDLINCWSTELQDAIKSARSECITIGNEGERDLGIAMFVYKQLIKRLTTGDVNYVDVRKELGGIYSKAQWNFLNFISSKIKNLFN